MNFKRTMFLFVIVLVSLSVSASQQGTILDALKFIIEKGKSGGNESMIHAYQYTCTTSVNNPEAIVFDSTHDMQSEFLEKAGLDNKHRERYSGLFADRSGERVMTLWSKYRDTILSLVGSDKVEKFFRQYYYTPASLLYVYQHPSFKDIMKNVMIKAGAAGGENIDEILSTELEINNVTASSTALKFWYRRYREGNHQQVYQVLKELDRHYGITCYTEKEKIGNSLGDFRRTRWGMSMKEVVECENDKPVASTDDYLCYKVSFRGEEVNLVYYFDDGILFSATYQFNKNIAINNDVLDEMINFHFDGEKEQKDFETPTIFTRDHTRVVNGIIVTVKNNREHKIPYLLYEDARIADKIRKKYSPYNLWKEDSRTILSLISGLRKFRHSHKDTTVQQDHKTKMLKKALVKLNREYKGKQIHINRAEILFMDPQIQLTPYGKKRYSQLMKKIKRDRLVGLDNTLFFSKWAQKSVNMKLRSDKRCFIETGKYEIVYTIPYPNDSPNYQVYSGISSDPDAEKKVSLIDVMIISVIDNQAEASKYYKNNYYSIDGKIKSIEYGTSPESVKIEIE